MWRAGRVDRHGGGMPSLDLDRAPAPPHPATTPRAPRPAAGARGAGAADAEWRALYGARWRGWLAVAVLGAFLVGLVTPLDDADLGMHLRVGEWIVGHGLPRTEPFAWTRAGAPYLAYSWLAESGYYLLWRAAGSWGLQALQGLVLAAGVIAAGWFARLARLPAWPAVLLATLHGVVTASLAGALRPQGVLTVVFPLAWAAAARLRLAARGEAPAARWPYALLAGAAALAANVHLFAPGLLGVAGLLVPAGAAARTARGWRPLALALGAVTLGLLGTPYAADWPAIVRLYLLSDSRILRFPSPIGELMPGVVAMQHGPALLWAFAVPLALLPWLAPRPEPSSDTRPAPFAPPALPMAVLWLGGLLLFGLAMRGLLVWWLVALPLVAAALGRVPALTASAVGRGLRALPLVLACCWGVQHGRGLWRAHAEVAGGGPRRLPNPAARAALHLADSLDRALPGSAGRLLTTFDYGNALLWRLPRHSPSLDGRAVFPDSATALDAWVPAWRRADTLRAPVASAELAILPVGHTALAQVARTAGWTRLARVAMPGAGADARDTAELWVRTAWAARWRRR